MIDKISNKILLFICTKDTTEEKKEILLFGITRIVEDIPKAIGIVLIGILIGILKEIIIASIVIALYKTFAGGVHAKTNLGCFIYSTMFYLAIIYSARYIIFTSEYKIFAYGLIYAFAIYTIVVYVPADVVEIPKVDLKLRKTLKIKTFIVLNVLYIVSIFLIKDIIYQNIVVYSVFYISLMTTRTIYKLFRTSYGYETYIPDELL